MSPEEQRIEMAHWCGWHDIMTMTGKEEYLGTFAYEYEGVLTGWRDSDHPNRIPDFLSDLNAMHDAEMRLPARKIDDYLYKLCLVVGVPPHFENGWDLSAKEASVVSTAAQRAEALLKTIGKWRTVKAQT